MIRYLHRSSNPRLSVDSLGSKVPLALKPVTLGLIGFSVTFLGCLAVMSASGDNWLLDVHLRAKDFGGNVRVEKTKPMQ